MTSALSAEHSIVGSRARLIVLIFSNNSIGSLTAGIVLLVLLKIFKGSVEANVNHFEWVWRLLLGLGIIPAACTLYARLRMRESKAYEQCKHPYIPQ